MLRKILGWFIKDHARASAKIMSAFDTIKRKLEKLNAHAIATKQSNQEAIDALRTHNTSLDTTIAKNSKVTANLSKLMGED